VKSALVSGVAVLVAAASVALAAPASAAPSTAYVGITGTGDSAIALDSSGRLFAMAGSTIRIYSSPTNLTNPTTCSITLESGATNASFMTVDSSGRVYLSFQSQDKVNVYANPLTSCASAPLQSIPTSDVPKGIAVDSSGSLWVASYGSNTVVKFNNPATSPALDTFYSVPGGPQGFALDGAGYAYVTTTNVSRVYKANLTANTVTFTNLGLTGLNVPLGITAQPNGLIQVVNNGSDLLTEYLTTNGSTSPTSSVDAGLYSSGQGLYFVVGPQSGDFYVGSNNGNLTSVSGMGIPPAVAGSSQAPPPILQQLPANADGTCTNVNDTEFSYGTGLTGGWRVAWGEWLNSRKGGPACSRTLVYNVNTNRWTINA
jgi:sugar lactone lactonase YvrE